MGIRSRLVWTAREISLLQWRSTVEVVRRLFLMMWQKLTVTEVSKIIDRVKAGDRIRFYRGFYGEQWVELSSGRIFRRRQRSNLSAAEVEEIKKTLFPNRQRVTAHFV